MRRFIPNNYRFIGPAAVLVFLVAACPAGGLAAGKTIWAPPGLARLIEEALENNAGIRSLAAQVKALQRRIPAAGALPDPRLGIAVQSVPTDSFDFDQEPMTQKQVFVEQSLPWPSKLELRSEAATGDAARKKAQLSSARLNLARDVAVSWYELGYVAESQQINERLVELIDRIRRDAQSRYAVGKGLQQDIFQAEVEASRLQDEAIMLANRRRAIEDRLHALLNRDRYRPVEPPGGLPAPDFALSPGKLTEEALVNNPELRGLQAAIRRARAETRLAEKAYYPDFNIRLTYGQRDEDRTGRDLPDFFSAAVTINIPLWHKTRQSNELAAAVENRHSALNRHQDVQSRLPHEIDALVTEIENTGRRYRLYAEELIARAGQWARAAEDAYQVGRVEFDTMISARIRVLKYRREASRLLFTVYQKRAELEALVGGTATALQGETSHLSKGEPHAHQSRK